MGADVTKGGQIYDFVVKCGWVKTESSVPKGASLHSASPSYKQTEDVSAHACLVSCVCARSLCVSESPERRCACSQERCLWRRLGLVV